MRRFTRRCQRSSPRRLLRIALRAPQGPRRSQALWALRGMGSEDLLQRLSALAHLLSSPNVLAWRVFELEAAERLADPRLLPQLRALQARVSTQSGIYSYWQRHLEDALAACGEGA
ncbi:MAG: hypothetical protein U1E77_21175 [Inhella sp.]